MDFEQLRSERKALNDAVLLHEQSVWLFKHPDRAWFRMTTTEEPTNEVLRHLSSSASCLESLADLPDYLATQDRQAVQEAFAGRAMQRAPDDWQSEKAARIYCRVRTLVPILALTPTEVLKPHQERLREHVNAVWERVEVSDAKQQGVSELPEPQEKNGERPEVSYPPNAFLTYWAVRLIEEYERHAGFPKLSKAIATKRAVAELWAEQVLGAQTAQIRGGAERTDAHQLAWALSLELRHADEPSTTSASPRLEVHRSALEAFFSKQAPSGAWPLSEPLFHYPAAGNAYCYMFETLAELVRPALDEERGAVARQLLRPHLEGLVRAWRLAERTQIRTSSGTAGWCSGHHPHRLDPESWATASVFSYLHALRRLTGYWAADEAASVLEVRRARWSGAEAEEKLRERGKTWVRDGKWTAGRQLASLFLHPIRLEVGHSPIIDPDRPLICEGDNFDRARSAILFGPPGTSKTTLIESLAGALGWRYVEIHASDFLSLGMDRVPARADEIFDQLMELDRCVVLFDEIDELIRTRTGTESDPFGRFLTTSMLPKLAKLWEQRRVLYFVATNDIDAADPAIRRSQRFDAAIFVSPPAYAVKIGLLKREFESLPSTLSEKKVNAALADGADKNPLGAFALLRYDQLALLAERLRGDGSVTKPTAEDLKIALEDLRVDMAANEWRRSSDKKDTVVDPFVTFRHWEGKEQRDARMLQLVAIDSSPPRAPAGTEEFHIPGEGLRAYRILARFDQDSAVDTAGRWPLNINKWRGRDDYLLDFKEV